MALNVTCVVRENACTIPDIELTNYPEMNHLEIQPKGATTQEIDRLILSTKNGYPAFTTIPTEILPKFPKLQMLLIKSGLTSLSSNDWQYAEHLPALYLFNLRIIKLLPNTFKGLNELEILSFSLSDLEILLRNAFVGLNDLSLLDLSQNKIHTIEDGALDLPRLKKLDLHSNLLRTLSESVFCKLPQLIDLDLSYNTLTHIGRSLECPQNLKKVVLLSNLIKDVDLMEMARLPSLEHLDLTSSGFLFTSANQYRLPFIVENSTVVTLEVFGTDLHNPFHFEHLRTFHNLKHLVMEDTPFIHFNYTGEKIRQFLPNLYTLRVVPRQPVDMKRIEKLKLILNDQRIEVVNVTARDYVILFPENALEL